jgi:hypothetical protein
MSVRPPIRFADMVCHLWPRISHAATALLAIATCAAILLLAVVGCAPHAAAVERTLWTEYQDMPRRQGLSSFEGMVFTDVRAVETIWLLSTDEPQKWPALPAGVWAIAEATAYCPCDKCTDGDRITADGTSTKRVPYNFAADRSVEMGTMLWIPPGLGVLDNARATDRMFIVDDRGSALDRESRESRVLRLDLRVRDHSWAVTFGRRPLPVYVCDPRFVNPSTR